MSRAWAQSISHSCSARNQISSSMTNINWSKHPSRSRKLLSVTKVKSTMRLANKWHFRLSRAAETLYLQSVRRFWVTKKPVTALIQVHNRSKTPLPSCKLNQNRTWLRIHKRHPILSYSRSPKKLGTEKDGHWNKTCPSTESLKNQASRQY